MLGSEEDLGNITKVGKRLFGGAHIDVYNGSEGIKRLKQKTMHASSSFQEMQLNFHKNSAFHSIELFARECNFSLI